MCGLYFKYSNKRNISELDIKEKLDRMNWRGPDDARIISIRKQTLGMGFVRLAINDLEERANQPFKVSYENHNYFIIFNGEIYNFKSLKIELRKHGFKFKTKSDTEVLLYSYLLWKEKCISKIDGMFAFAIYDEKLDHVFIGRDRFGQKPLFFYHSKNGIELGSQANLFDQTKINDNEKTNFFTYGYTFGEDSIFRDIKKFPINSYGFFDIKNNKLDIKKSTCLKPFMKKRLNAPLNLAALENSIITSLSNCLIADVPIGLLLSGGIDSSLLLQYSLDIKRDINVFNASYGGSSNFNESPIAEKFCKENHLKLNKLQLSDLSVDEFIDFTSKLDEPLADPAALGVYQLTKGLKENGITVGITGDGGDELFLGYPHYRKAQNARYLKLIFKNLNFLPKEIFKFKDYSNRLLGLIERDKHISTFFNMYFNKYERKDMMLSEYSSEDVKQTVWDNSPGDYIERQQDHDINFTLSNGYLVKSDRSSMINSVELRSPLLCESVVDFVNQNRGNILGSSKQDTKFHLRLLAKQRLPEYIFNKKKTGFTFPLQNLIYGKNEKYFKELMLDSQIFSKQDASSLFEDGKKSKRLLSLVYLVCNYEQWSKIKHK